MVLLHLPYKKWSGCNLQELGREAGYGWLATWVTDFHVVWLATIVAIHIKLTFKSAHLVLATCSGQGSHAGAYCKIPLINE